MGKTPTAVGVAAVSDTGTKDEAVGQSEIAYTRFTRAARPAWLFMEESDGRSGRIRTCDPLIPNQVRYQAALHSDVPRRIGGGRPEGNTKTEVFRSRPVPLH